MFDRLSTRVLRDQVDAAGLCVDSSDPDAWIPVSEPDQTTARRLCAGCTVKAECLEVALRIEDTRPSFGVFGARTAKERRAMVRKRQADRAAALTSVLPDSGSPEVPKEAAA